MKNNYAWMFFVVLLMVVAMQLVIMNKLDSQCHVTYVHSDVLGDSDMIDEQN